MPPKQYIFQPGAFVLSCNSSCQSFLPFFALPAILDIIHVPCKAGPDDLAKNFCYSNVFDGKREVLKVRFSILLSSGLSFDRFASFGSVKFLHFFCNTPASRFCRSASIRSRHLAFLFFMNFQLLTAFFSWSILSFRLE